MTVIPRFSATHHHGRGSLHTRIRPPIVMYSSNGSSPPRSELHHHHHHVRPSGTGYPQYHPPSIHFHHGYPHHHHISSRPPASSIHTSHPPPPIQQPTSNNSPLPPILTKPPLKEKTPMCLVNELVRFNKIKYQYRLTDESGPSHKKSFTVLLMLGDESSDVYEEYIASGESIKKAQHAAAALAMEETKLKHPLPKMKPMIHNGTLLPTVELNTLAMKRREQIQYELIHPYHDPKCQRKDMRRNGGNKVLLKSALDSSPSSCPNKEGPFDKKFIVNLKVGKRNFKGEGVTLKGAKHNAAYAALVFLKNTPASSANKFELDPSSAPFVPGNPLSSKSSNEHKSPVSLVHESALKRNLSVTFRVESESGPPHLKTFVTRCTMGEFSTEGQGEAKKTSKKRSAELMLEKLKTLPPLANCSVSKRSSSSSGSKSDKRKSNSSAKRRAKSSLVKLQKSESESEASSSVHPISRLIQIQQAKKEKEPIYSLVEEKGRKRKLEFVMQVKVGELSAQGSGHNKKSAKRVAAENMLEMMGVSGPAASKMNQSQEANGSDEKSISSSKSTKKTNTCSVPGIIFLEHASKINGQNVDNNEEVDDSLINNKNKSDFKPPTTKCDKQFILNKNLDFLEDIGEAKVKLAKLSEIFKFSVSYTDFQKKGKHSSVEYLTLVSLSMKPTQVSHGSGATPQESQEDAAKSALKFLAENGLEVPSGGGGSLSNENGGRLQQVDSK